MRPYGYGAKSRWDFLGFILGPMGSHWSKKCFKTVKHYHARKFEFSTTPRSSISAKMWPYGYGAKSRWDFLGFILGPMGSHWVKKMGKNRKKLPCLKIPIFDYPTVIDFGQNATLRLWRQITIGIPWGPSWGQWGPIGSKNGSKPLKITMLQNSNFRLTGGHRFRPKCDLTVMAPNHGGDPLGTILGSMGSHWVQKMGQNRKKLPCPKIRLPHGHRFRPKCDLTIMAPNHGGDPLGSILGPLGPKNGSKP